MRIEFCNWFEQTWVVNRRSFIDREFYRFFDRSLEKNRYFIRRINIVNNFFVIFWYENDKFVNIVFLTIKIYSFVFNSSKFKIKKINMTSDILFRYSFFFVTFFRLRLKMITCKNCFIINDFEIVNIDNFVSVWIVDSIVNSLISFLLFIQSIFF